MKSRLIFLLLAAHAGAALAQYKCTAANGAITFQQTPCFGAKSEEKLVIVPNGHPPPASGVPARVAGNGKPGNDKPAPSGTERDRQHDALERAVRAVQDDKARRASQRAEDIDAARKQFGDDPARAAALQEALASIDKRYSAISELDASRLKSAQAALDDLERAPAAK
jgi:hypothetical protein